MSGGRRDELLESLSRYESKKAEINKVEKRIKENRVGICEILQEETQSAWWLQFL
jgi:hypothetical protein